MCITLQVTVAYDPILPSSRPARDFLSIVKKPKTKTEFPKLQLNEIVRSDKGYVCLLTLLSRMEPHFPRLRPSHCLDPLPRLAVHSRLPTVVCAFSAGNRLS